MPILELQGRQITYTVVKGKSRRYVYFKFRPDRTLEIHLPQGKVDLDAVLRKKRDWILRKYEDLSMNKKVYDPDAGTIQFKGRSLKIVSDGNPNTKTRKSKIGENEIVLQSCDQVKTMSEIRQLFSKETLRYLKRILPLAAERLSTEFNTFDVRQIKKWGYCNRQGRLSFSWQLIALPKRLRDYVVMHELVHLSEFNHANAFHKKLASACPDYRDREIELKRFVPM